MLTLFSFFMSEKPTPQMKCLAELLICFYMYDKIKEKVKVKW